MRKFLFALVLSVPVLAACTPAQIAAVVGPPKLITPHDVAVAIAVDPIERWKCPTDLTLRWWYRTNNEGRANVADPRIRAKCVAIAPIALPL